MQALFKLKLASGIKFTHWDREVWPVRQCYCEFFTKAKIKGNKEKERVQTIENYIFPSIVKYEEQGKETQEWQERDKRQNRP